MSDKGKNPWGDSGQNKGGKNNNPWGNGPQHAQSPDMEDVIKNAQEKLNTMFGGGNGGGGHRGGSQKSGGGSASGFGIGFLFLILLVLWGGTGFYRVQPAENAVIMTFGKMTDTRTETGLGYHFPWPIQQVVTVNVDKQRSLDIGFRSLGNRRGQDIKDVRDEPSESLMVTGDENIIDIDFVVLWDITDAGKYLFAIRNPEKTVKKVAESAMREIIGQTDIQPALTGARADIESKTKLLMQEMLDEYQSGINIDQVQLQKVSPPRQVVDAFDDVQRARADKERAKNQADAYRNSIIPKARGEAEQQIQQAEAYKQSVINIATGEAERFNSVYRAYSSSKDITARRLYLETMQEILANGNKIILDSEGQGVLPYLPLDRMQK